MTYALNVEQRDLLIKEQVPKSKSRMKLVSSVKEYLRFATKEYRILVDDNLKPQQIIQMCIDREIKHIIQNSKLGLPEKMQIIDGILADPFKFMTFNEKIFPDAVNDLLFLFHAKEDRTTLVMRVLDHLKIDVKNHNTEHIFKATEELIMNAQLHAPRIGDFKSPHTMSFLVERKGDLIALSVFDDYGSMNIGKFLNKILNAFIIGTAGAINYGTGGAGLGSSIIFETAEVLIIAVLPKRITRVTVLTPLKKREKDRDSEQKSIHIINSL